MKDQPDIVARLRDYTRHNKPVLASDLKEAADEIERLRRELNASVMRAVSLETSLDIAAERSSLLIDLARAVSEAAGREVLLNAFDRADLQHLVEDVAALRRDRDALMPADLPETVEAPPTVTPSTERFDEIECRIARLESSLRITRRRLTMAGDALHADGVTGIGEAASVLRGLRDA